MNNVPRQILRQIVAKYGKDICADARRCKGLLKDLCGQHTREINVLTNAVEERIPLDLLAGENSVPRRLLFTRLAKRLENNLGLTAEAADWAVHSWAFALGIVPDADIKAAAENRKTAAAQSPASEPVPPVSQKAEPQPPPQNPPTATKPRTPKIYPPLSNPLPNVPPPAPKPTPPKIGSNAAIPQNFPPANQNAPAPVVRKRFFGKFFGCLLIFFLIIAAGIVLLFGVPYAIEVMRDTQRGEPQRFPAR